MADHVKPTQEELKAEADQALKDLEAMDDKDEEKKVEVPPIEEEPTEEVEEIPEPPVVEEEQEAEPSKEEAEPSKEIYKKKFSESSREAQKISAKNRVINKALIEADDIGETTEEELKEKYGDKLDVMSDVEVDFAKTTIKNDKWITKIREASNQATKIEKWNESVETYADDPKTLLDNPELEGKTEDFKEFATRETNNSVPFNLLVSAFLFEKSKDVKTNKGRMFENGSGGPNDRPKRNDGKITLAQAEVLRNTNYNKYKEYLVKDKISDE